MLRSPMVDASLYAGIATSTSQDSDGVGSGSASRGWSWLRAAPAPFRATSPTGGATRVDVLPWLPLSTGGSARSSAEAVSSSRVVSLILSPVRGRRIERYILTSYEVRTDC